MAVFGFVLDFYLFIIFCSSSSVGQYSYVSRPVQPYYTDRSPSRASNAQRSSKTFSFLWSGSQEVEESLTFKKSLSPTLNLLDANGNIVKRDIETEAEILDVENKTGFRIAEYDKTLLSIHAQCEAQNDTRGATKISFWLFKPERRYYSRDNCSKMGTGSLKNASWIQLDTSSSFITNTTITATSQIKVPKNEHQEHEYWLRCDAVTAAGTNGSNTTISSPPILLLPTSAPQKKISITSAASIYISPDPLHDEDITVGYSAGCSAFLSAQLVVEYIRNTQTQSVVLNSTKVRDKYHFTNRFFINEEAGTIVKIIGQFFPIDSRRESVNITRTFVVKQAVEPSFPSRTQNNTVVTIEAGQLITLECNVSAGRPSPTIKWLKDGKLLRLVTCASDTTSMPFEFLNDKKTLKIARAQVEDAGVYECEASNRLGINGLQWSVVVRLVQNSTINIEEGQLLQLNCNVTVVQWMNFTVEWSKNGQPLGNASHLKRLHGNKLLEIAQVELHDGGHYKCAAENDRIQAWSEWLVSAFLPSQIKKYNTTSIENGQSLTLVCDVSVGRLSPSSSLFTIEWMKNGHPFTSSSLDFQLMHENKTLMIAAVEFQNNNSELYECVVSTGFKNARQLWLITNRNPHVSTAKHSFVSIVAGILCAVLFVGLLIFGICWRRESKHARRVAALLRSSVKLLTPTDSVDGDNDTIYTAIYDKRKYF